ncbi:MAG: hypothetical protein V2A78_03075 [bacterium]
MGEMKSIVVCGKISFNYGLQPSFFREETTPVGSLTLYEFKGLYIKIVFKNFEAVINGIVDPSWRVGTVVQVEEECAEDGAQADLIFEMPGHKTVTISSVPVSKGNIDFGEVLIESEEPV